MENERGYFNMGYDDCCDPYKGVLTRKPEAWRNKDWLFYQNGVDAFNSDTYAIKNDQDSF